MLIFYLFIAWEWVNKYATYYQIATHLYYSTIHRNMFEIEFGKYIAHAPHNVFYVKKKKSFR